MSDQLSESNSVRDLVPHVVNSSNPLSTSSSLSYINKLATKLPAEKDCTSVGFKDYGSRTRTMACKLVLEDKDFPRGLQH